MGLIQQTVNGWGDWPDDVRDRLRAWNADFLLSFRVTGDFFCSGCGRAIAGHPTGNAIVRPAPKRKGSPYCESCLVALARTYETPPPNTERGVYAVWRAARERDQAAVEKLRQQVEKLRRQLAVDQVYMDELEKLVDPDQLRALRDRLRGQNRRSR